MTNPIAVRDDNVPVAQGQTFFQALRALGLSHFEMQLGFDGAAPSISRGGSSFSLNDDAGVQSLKARLQDEGASIVSFLLATDFSGAQAQQHVEATIRFAHIARELGVPAIRLDPLTAERDLTPSKIRDNVVRYVTGILEQTKETGVDFGLENHGITGNDPRFLDEVFEAVGDDRLGMTLDTANFYWSGLPLSEVYAILEHFAPRAKHTHVKSIAYPAELRDTRREADSGYARYCSPLDEGDFDLSRVVRILRNAGYTRSLCIENEALSRYASNEQADVIRRDVVALQAAQ